MADGPCNVYTLNQAFLDALEFMDRVIVDRSFRQKRLYFDLIPRGAYPLGEGLVRKLHKFHGSTGDQAAMTSWRSIQVSRAAAGDDPGYDSCRYESEVVDYAFETVQFSGFETSRRSKDICLNDIKWKWEFKQQLKLIFGFLADITLSIWENHGREMYLKMCADAGQIYVLAQGSPDSTPLQSTYNPFTNDRIEIDRDLDIGTLDWSYMDWWHMYLSLQAPMSALAQEDGMGIWGLVIHAKDFDYMIRKDAEIREDYRYANSQVLIDQYGKVKRYKGFAIIHDPLAPRYQARAGGLDSDTITLERVLPYTTEATTVGSKPIVNADYINAQFAMGVIFLNGVFETLIPPSGPASPGGGTQFGAQPSLNGEFKWLNIIDRCENPLGEKGYYFSRYQAFARPGEYHSDAVAFLYKRCPQIDINVCEPCDVTGTGAQTITAATGLPDTDVGESATSYTKVSMTLAACLPCEAPAEIDVDYDGGGATDVTGVIVDDSEAPTYVVEFATAANYVTGGAIVANTSTGVCG